MSSKKKESEEFQRRLLLFLEVITGRNFQGRKMSLPETRPEGLCKKGEEYFERLYTFPGGGAGMFLMHYPECSENKCYPGFKKFLKKTFP